MPHKCNLSSDLEVNCLQGMLPIHYVDVLMCGSEQEPMKTLLGFGGKDARNNEVSVVDLHYAVMPIKLCSFCLLGYACLPTDLV